jgi:lipopolysaccharide transport protein LptA
MDRRSIITAFFILVIASFFVWALLPRPDINTIIAEKIKDEGNKADVMFKDATLAEIYDGIKYWELVSKTSLINKSTGKADLTTVDGLFFDKGQATLKFLAPTAIWAMKSNEILLFNPVGYDIKHEKQIIAMLNGTKDGRSVFHLSEKKNRLDGYWFQAKNLNWKLETKRLQCKGSIFLTKGNATITSDKLEADVGLEKVKLSQNPSAEVKLKDEIVLIRAKEFMIDSAEDTIIAKDNVVLTSSSSVIKTSLCVYHQSLGTMHLAGEVFIADGQIKAYSKTADYDILAKKVTLFEDAKVVREGNEIYGQKMVIYLGENRVIVQGRSKAKVQEVDIK